MCRAREYQYPPSRYPGVDVFHCPFDDEGGVSRRDLMLVVATARAVAYAQRAQFRTLVTCAAGVNRSALVAGLAIRMLGADDAVDRIRSARFSTCLSNQTFRGLVDGTEDMIREFLPLPNPKNT